MNTKNFKQNDDSMNVLWTKTKLRKRSAETMMTPVLASGDGCPGSGLCRICGATSTLQNTSENGIVDILETCFKVKVPGVCSICNQCSKLIEMTEKFRVLVYAAFDKITSLHPSKEQFQLITELPQSINSTNNPQKQLENMSSTKIKKPSTKQTTAKRRKSTYYDNRPKSMFYLNKSVPLKKVNIICSICKQRYSMIESADASKKFICARCKKFNSNCNEGRGLSWFKPASLIKEVQVKHQSLLGKSRPNMPKKPQQMKQLNQSNPGHYFPKYQCSQCSKRYAVSDNLAAHIRETHGDSTDQICTLCGIKLKSKECLIQHWREHKDVKIHQCTKCMRILKSKRALQTHYREHHKQRLFT